jgi:hypothetical protein
MEFDAMQSHFPLTPSGDDDPLVLEVDIVPVNALHLSQCARDCVDAL